MLKGDDIHQMAIDAHRQRGKERRQKTHRAILAWLDARQKTPVCDTKSELDILAEDNRGVLLHHNGPLHTGKSLRGVFKHFRSKECADPTLRPLTEEECYKRGSSVFKTHFLRGLGYIRGEVDEGVSIRAKPSAQNMGQPQSSHTEHIITSAPVTRTPNHEMAAGPGLQTMTPNALSEADSSSIKLHPMESTASRDVDVQACERPSQRVAKAVLSTDHIKISKDHTNTKRPRRRAGKSTTALPDINTSGDELAAQPRPPAYSPLTGDEDGVALGQGSYGNHQARLATQSFAARRINSKRKRVDNTSGDESASEDPFHRKRPRSKNKRIHNEHDMRKALCQTLKRKLQFDFEVVKEAWITCSPTPSLL